jgi:ubiquinone biosynthesis protein COQ9
MLKNIVKFFSAKKKDEQLEVLKSIDKRLEKLEKLEECVVKNHRRYGNNFYLSTGHWNG